MSTRIFKRPVIDRKELDKELEKAIYEKTTDLERLENVFKDRMAQLESDYSASKEQKSKDIADLENILVFKRQERTHLESPLLQRENLVQEREQIISQREKDVSVREQSTFERDLKADRMISDM
jgi:uncharacterized protein (DUF3084 family)